MGLLKDQLIAGWGIKEGGRGEGERGKGKGEGILTI